MSLRNIFVLSTFKVKMSDYAVHTFNSNVEFGDQLRIDLFDFGVCILKMLGVLVPEDNLTYFDYDK